MEFVTLYSAAAIALILVGLAGVLIKRNLIKMALGFSLLGTGANILIVTLGYVRGATAPIVDSPALLEDVGSLVVKQGAVMDPVPQALVLTAIVIGVGVTGLMLATIVRLYANTKTLDVNALTRLKW